MLAANAKGVRSQVLVCLLARWTGLLRAVSDAGAMDLLYPRTGHGLGMEAMKPIFLELTHAACAGWFFHGAWIYLPGGEGTIEDAGNYGTVCSTDRFAACVGAYVTPFD